MLSILSKRPAFVFGLTLWLALWLGNFYSPIAHSTPQKAAELFSISTPTGNHFSQEILTAQSRDAQNTVYLKQDTGESLEFDKVNLRSQFLNPAELMEALRPFQKLADRLISERAHRYIGRSGTTARKPFRTLRHRTQEHTRNSKKGRSRIYLGYHQAIRQGKMIVTQALVTNINPLQIGVVEACLIGLFRTTGPLGWNSNGGDRTDFGSYRETSDSEDTLDETTDTSKASIAASPHSNRARNSVYLLLDAEKIEWGFESIDFQNLPIYSFADLVWKTRSLRTFANRLYDEKIPRYIGRSSSKVGQERSFESRKREHERDAAIKDSRLYAQLKGQFALGRVLVENIAPQDIATVEAYLIGYFRSNEDYGLNSNSGKRAKLDFSQ